MSINNAPYTYLLKNKRSSLYTLFIHIPTKKGYGVKFPDSPKTISAITAIECEIEKGASQNSKKYILEKPIDNSDASISVRVGYGNYLSDAYQSILLFDHADQAPEQLVIQDDLAIESPYSFLNRPDSYYIAGAKNNLNLNVILGKKDQAKKLQMLSAEAEVSEDGDFLELIFDENEQTISLERNHDGINENKVIVRAQINGYPKEGIIVPLDSDNPRPNLLLEMA